MAALRRLVLNFRIFVFVCSILESWSEQLFGKKSSDAQNAGGGSGKSATGGKCWGFNGKNEQIGGHGWLKLGEVMADWNKPAVVESNFRSYAGLEQLTGSNQWLRFPVYSARDFG
jgi:hypothetical protein